MEGFEGVGEHRSTRHGRVWFHPVVLAKVQMTDHRRVPGRVREETFEGLASPVTAATFAGPRDSRSRRIAATNSRGDRSNSGPFARNTASARLALVRFDSPTRIDNSPANPSSGTSRSAMESGIPFTGGRSSARFPIRGAKKLPL